ncbi:MAG: RsmD family RNA methyltransferase [Leeuwenhoekiella sp.]
MQLPAIDREIQEYLKNNLNLAPAAVALGKSPFSKVTPRELAEQLTGLKKAKVKLPTWFNAEVVLFPPAVNLEQTSSEATANYKASLIKGNKMLDLTAGFGIDDYFFGRYFKEVVGFELNETLVGLQHFNLKNLNVHNVNIIKGDGVEFLKQTNDHFDLIYLDPSRRDDNHAKVFQLSDCTPDVGKNLNLLLEKGNQVMIKTSPLLDITQGLRELQQTAHIHIVSVENEVKELLWLLPKNNEQTLELTAVNLSKKEVQKVNVDHYESALNQIATYGPPQNFIYEPNAALLKSGLFNWISKNFGLTKLHPNSHLYTSETFIPHFPGRSFKILGVTDFNKNKVKKVWKNRRANVTTRNFRWTVSKIRSYFGINDGGEDYLFFTTGHQDDALLIHTRKTAY